MNRFIESYEGTPPWEVGHPQSAIVRLLQKEQLKGPILDVGCGTGENTLFLAAQGYQITGVDIAPNAIEKARQKAKTRKLDVDFLVHDALNLDKFGRQFETLVDSGVFHVFSDEERSPLLHSLQTVLSPGGRYYLICFSDREPNWGGPRRITKTELYQVFKDNWQIESIQEETFDINIQDKLAQAWLVVVRNKGLPVY